jgi:site-specific recombinase XerD
MTVTANAPRFATLVQQFFCQRLVEPQNASARTVASYRDTFRLLLNFFAECRGRSPAVLSMTDLDAPAVLVFLDHLEQRRRDCIRTRNARLAALRAFLKFAAARDPACLPAVQRVLAIPMKRFQRPLLGHLSPEEVAALLAAPDQTTWSGQRDLVLFTLMYNTGQRRGRDATATLRQIRPAMLLAAIMRALAGWVVRRQAMTAHAADDQALQQRGATLRRPLGIVQRSILLQAFSIGEVLLPRIVSWQPISSTCWGVDWRT